MKGKKKMETKEWYKSKTIWSAIIIAIVGTLNLFGIDALLGEEEAVTEIVMQVITIIASITALVGRIQAKKKITITKKSGTSNPTATLLLLAISLSLIFSGCGKVHMSADYARQVEMAAVNCAILNERCQAGDEQACKEGLNLAAETLNLIVDGMHNVSGGENTEEK